VLTAIAGTATAHGDGWCETLEPFGSLIVPADAGPYAVAAKDLATIVLLGRLPSPREA